MKAEMLQQEVHPGWNLFLCFTPYEVYLQIFLLECLGCLCFVLKNIYFLEGFSCQALNNVAPCFSHMNFIISTLRIIKFTALFFLCW